MPKPKNIIKAFLIIDTCLIIKAFEYSKTKYFDDFINIFKEYTTTINDFIKFEFIRDCKILNHLNIKNKFINSIIKAKLPYSSDLHENSIKISNIYSNKNFNNHQIGLVDIYNSAFLKKYEKSNLLLITLDLKDYPLLIHDRIKVITIDTQKEVINLGIYKFNQKKYKQCLSQFKKTKI